MWPFWTIGHVQPEIGIESMKTKVDAYIVRDPNGVCRVMVKRAKYKHWFELGRHAATDAAFEQALAAGSVCWNPKIVDRSKLF